MPIPPGVLERAEYALGRAWTAAERADKLNENNNGNAAMSWAAAAQAWAAIALAANTTRVEAGPQPGVGPMSTQAAQAPRPGPPTASGTPALAQPGPPRPVAAPGAPAAPTR